MSVQDRLMFLQQLQSEGAQIVIEAPAVGGVRSFVLSPERAVAFLENKNMVYASCYGVRTDEFRSWLDQNYSVTCSGLTATGRPCRNIVKGGYELSPNEWVELQGTLCHSHGNGLAGIQRELARNDIVTIDLNDPAQFTVKNTSKLIGSVLDTKHRQLRVTKAGLAYLSDVVGSDEIDHLAFRLETWSAGNNYVGFQAAHDEDWVNSVHQKLKDNWPEPCSEYI